MATANIVAGTADNFLQKYSAANWAGCLAASPNPGTVTTTTYSLKRTYSTAWTLQRIYMSFDLSEYAGATISAATLNLFGSGAAGTNDYKVYYQDWGADVASGDWADVGTLTAASTTQNVTGWGHDIAISLTNLDSLLTANGGLVLILDDEATEPEEDNAAGLYSSNETTEARKPNLDITYTEAASLSIPLLNHLLLGD